MKTILKCFWLFAFLALAASLEAQPAQSFSWTVTGTGTETWYTSITNYTSQTASIYGSDSPPSQSISITAGASGQGTFEAYIIAGPGYGLSYAYMFSGSTTLFQYCVGNGDHPPNQTHGPLYFMAETNATYDLKARVVGAGYSSVTVTVPQSIQPQTNTAPRQATATGTNSVSISDGKKTINGLSAPPQPANGGSISNVTYSLTWNNPSVSLVFSDTLTTSTLNPTSIVAVAPFPGQPTHLSTTTNYAGSGGWVTIGISWSPAPWATGYEFVSAKAVNGVVQTPVTNAVAGTNFLDTGHPPGTPCEYYVIATNSNGAGPASATDGVVAVGTYVLNYGTPQIQVQAASFGVHTNRFGFGVTGLSNQVVVIEACTNLSKHIWVPLQTNKLGTNTLYFFDSRWTNYHNRYYRVLAP